MVENGVSAIIAAFSIIGLSIVFMTIFNQPKLKEHPSPLIARICMAEAVMCWFTVIKVVDFDYIICYLHLY